MRVATCSTSLSALVSSRRRSAAAVRELTSAKSMSALRRFRSAKCSRMGKVLRWCTSCAILVSSSCTWSNCSWSSGDALVTVEPPCGRYLRIEKCCSGSRPENPKDRCDAHSRAPELRNQTPRGRPQYSGRHSAATAIRKQSARYRPNRACPCLKERFRGPRRRDDAANPRSHRHQPARRVPGRRGNHPNRCTRLPVGCALRSEERRVGKEGGGH